MSDKPFTEEDTFILFLIECKERGIVISEPKLQNGTWTYEFDLCDIPQDLKEKYLFKDNA